MIGGVAGTLVKPGVVEATFIGRTWLGEVPRGTSERVEGLTAVLDGAGLPAVAAADITAVKWVKLIQFCAYAGVSALTLLRLYEITQDPRLLEVHIELLREGGRVMKAAGTEPENQMPAADQKNHGTLQRCSTSRISGGIESTQK